MKNRLPTAFSFLLPPISFTHAPIDPVAGLLLKGAQAGAKAIQKPMPGATCQRGGSIVYLCDSSHSVLHHASPACRD